MSLPSLPTLKPAAPVSPADALTPLVATTFNSSTLYFFLNSTPITLNSHEIDPSATLLDFLRSQRRLKGTKLGCGEGGCGACTVVVQKVERTTERIECLCVNSCLLPLVAVDGKHIITVEGIGTAASPHPVQERMSKFHGSQCGFCTPGIVMSLYALLRNAYNPTTKELELTEEDIELEGALDGNLCRCTGYKPILEAAKSFILDQAGQSEQHSSEKTTSCGPGNCCQIREGSSGDSSSTSISESPSTPDTEYNAEVPLEGATYGALVRSQPCKRADCCQLPLSNAPKATTSVPSFPQFELLPYTPRTELIFPPLLRKHFYKPLFFGNERKVWFRPVTLQQLLDIKDRYPSAKLVSGASETQVETRLKGVEFTVSVYVGDIQELRGVKTEGDCLAIGANASLTELEKACKKLVREEIDTLYALEAILKQLKYFGGRQIKNCATPAGNIATASPISDLNPVFIAADAIVVAQSIAQGPMEFRLADSEFFSAYRTTALPADAIITKILVPFGNGSREVIKTYKQSKRKEDDIAIVTAAFRVKLSEDNRVEDVCLAYGGMGPTTAQAIATGKYLRGRQWFDPAVLESAMAFLEEDFSLAYSVPGGMATYRKTLAFMFFLRFWHEVAKELCISKDVDEDIATELTRGLSSGTRDTENPYEQRVVGKRLPHLSGLKHATGEAEYIDDIPTVANELHGAFVLSARAHAKLVSVSWTAAMGMPGVRSYVDANDLPKDRSIWGSVEKVERFFANDVVEAHGQTIGLVVADTAAQAQAAAKAVNVEYEDLPAIITIDEAIEKQSFWPHGKMLKRGVDLENSQKSIEKALEECDHVFEGVSRIGGQEHFYLETNASLVIPGAEDGQIEVWSSTQNPMETQEFVSVVLGVPSNRVVARVKRMGGAFGGKESRSVPIACSLALAARKTGRPVRIMLNRDEDMMMTGQRHPFKASWKVGVSKDGTLQVLDADIYNNAGFSSDMSSAVADRCLTHVDNCYYWPKVWVRGHVCKTNTHSNTAFRGFGGPQGMYITEQIMTAIAENLSIDIDELRLKNLYKEGQQTPFLQPILDWHVPQLLRQIRDSSSYDTRKRAVDDFNGKHGYRKRGISLLPTKFGLSFATAIHLNQAGALVHIYNDGSILLAHGGTEMGQGLYTKMCQVAAEELRVPVDSVFTADSGTNTIANSSPTAASSGSDLNGMAVKHACAQLNERLKPYREEFGHGAEMKILAHAAYLDRVNLSANGFYKTPDIGFLWGNYVDPLPMYYYFTQGAAVSEVEVDLLTGSHTVLRSDILMDIGRSINPAIDYGQVEGAFVQGMGLFTTEESLWSTRNGTLVTRGPGNYKIPAFGDVPVVFNSAFLKSPESRWKNLKSIQSSKGVGEPPLFLGASVFFAIADAVEAAGGGGLQAPATCAKIVEAIGGTIWERMKAAREDGECEDFLRAEC